MRSTNSKKKIADTNTYDMFVTKTQGWKQFQEMYGAGRVRKETILWLIDEMLVWVKDPMALCVEEFLELKYIDEDTWYGWVQRFPELKAAYKYVKTVLAGRRDKGALRHELHAGYVQFNQPHFSLRAREMAEYHAALKNPKNEQVDRVAEWKEVLAQTLAPSPLTAEVPERKQLKAE